MTAKERAAAWRANNRERHRAYSRQYYHGHKEEQLARIVEYQKEHKDRHNATCRKWNKTHPDYKKTHHHLRRYGITPEDYQRMFDEQDGKCAICGKTENLFGTSERLHVDHCHKSGIVRGLLCGQCNVMLGASTDDPDIMRKGAVYLERHKICPSEAA